MLHRPSDGSLEALKWLALAFMLGDHINKFLYFGTLDGLTEAGRMAAPIFATVFGYNLSRLNSGAYSRIGKRLLIGGVLASPPLVAMGMTVPLWLFRLLSPYEADWLFNYWWPLNILFSLLAAAGVVNLLEKRCYFWSLALFLLTGFFIEFYWFIAIICVAAWATYKYQNLYFSMLWIFGIVALYFVNNSFYAILAVPVMACFWAYEVKVPRYKLAFYVFYPLHLWILFIYRNYIR